MAPIQGRCHVFNDLREVQYRLQAYNNMVEAGRNINRGEHSSVLMNIYRSKGYYSGVPNSQTRLTICAVTKWCRVFFYLLQ